MPRNTQKLIFVAGFAAAIAACKPMPQVASESGKNPDAVKVEFFVMSQCPFGVEVVNKFKEVSDKLGSDVDLKIEFIGTVAGNGDLGSMHGANEVAGDKAQLCAAKYAPTKYMEMISCQNKNYREVATNWEACAKSAQLPVESIRTCLNGPEGKQLLKESFERAQSRQARGSPTIFVAGKSYDGRRSSDAFLRAVCAAHQGPKKPQACENIPAPAVVNVILMGDKRCAECSTDRYVGMLKQRVANPNIKVLDYAEPEGRKFYDELPNGGTLPAIYLDSTLDADKEAQEVFRNLQSVGSYRRLNLNGSWNPVCANEGGCELTQCKDTLSCRKESPKQLELFVMSQCPYGVRALNAMDEVLRAFDKKIDFQVHYIANSDGKGGFSSLHGQGEVDENIRELCAIKHFPKSYQWMDYVSCRNADIRSGNWEACTSARKESCPDKDQKPAAGALTHAMCEASKKIDAKVMAKCFEGDEGKKLLEEDIKLANALGIGGSPSWIANGRSQFHALDAETIKRNLCEKNKNEIAGCDKTLSGPGASAPVQGGCGK